MPMATTMWDVATRQATLARLGCLRPDAPPLWGRFSARAMVAHLIDASRMALGTMPVRRSPGSVARVIRLPGMRHFFVYMLPFPRNAPTARELLTGAPGDWDADIATFTRTVDDLAEHAQNRDAKWPEHPFFGPLTGRDWGVLCYRHTDHHLRQFRV